MIVRAFLEDDQLALSVFRKQELSENDRILVEMIHALNLWVERSLPKGVYHAIEWYFRSKKSNHVPTKIASNVILCLFLFNYPYKSKVGEILDEIETLRKFCSQDELEDIEIWGFAIRALRCHNNYLKDLPWQEDFDKLLNRNSEITTALDVWTYWRLVLILRVDQNHTRALHFNQLLLDQLEAANKFNRLQLGFKLNIVIETKYLERYEDCIELCKQLLTEIKENLFSLVVLLIFHLFNAHRKMEVSTFDHEEFVTFLRTCRFARNKRMLDLALIREIFYYSSFVKDDERKTAALQEWVEYIQDNPDIYSFQELAFSFYQLGHMFLLRGEYRQAKKYYVKSYKIFNDYYDTLPKEIQVFDFCREIKSVYEFVMGDYYKHTGEISTAIYHFERGLDLQVDVTVNTSLVRYYLGIFYHQQGKLQQALVSFENGLDIICTAKLFKSVVTTQNEVFNLKELGIVYQSMHEHRKALDYFEQALEMSKTELRTDWFAQFSSSAIISYLESSQRQKAKELLDELAQLEDQIPQESELFTHQWADLTRALYHKFSKRIHDLGKAQQLLREILEQPTSSEIELLSLINLLDLLIVELEFTGEELVFDEIHSLLEKTEKLARKMKSLSLLANTYLIKARLEVINLNYDEGLALLDKAKDITVKQELRVISADIENYRAYINNNLNKWIEVLGKNTNLSDRVKESKIVDYMKTARQFVQSEGLEKIPLP